jgi:four helix bundle protein
MGIVEEEADETMYWLELIMEANLMEKSRLKLLYEAANKLTAIFTASAKTAHQTRNSKKILNRKSEIRNQKN